MGGDPRHVRVHLQNVRIAASARRHHFDERIGIPFLCECDDDLCREFVVVALIEFERTIRGRLTVVAPDHTVAGAVLVAERDGYTVVRIANGHSQSV